MKRTVRGLCTEQHVVRKRSVWRTKRTVCDEYKDKRVVHEQTQKRVAHTKRSAWRLKNESVWRIEREAGDAYAKQRLVHTKKKHVVRGWQGVWCIKRQARGAYKKKACGA